MQKRAFIVHGLDSNPNANWFPYLRGKLESIGFAVSVPQMPDAAHPTLSAWFGHLKKIVTKPDENTYFIGHSLGVIAILRFLESLPEDVHVGGAVLVAGFCERIGIQTLNTFFPAPLLFDRIKQRARKISAIQSDDDPRVPIEQNKMFEEKLGAKLVIIHGGKHLNADAGYTELPEALTEITAMGSLVA